MSRDKQDETAGKLLVSPLSKDKTYGERVYNSIFNVALNFWINLLAAGTFSFWVKHSYKPIKLPFIEKEFESLNVKQDRLIEWLKDKPVVNSSLKGIERRDRAESIVNVFTLLIPGHLVMIPSVWLGAKVKAPIVEYFNRRHYGDEAMESPDLIARHHALRTEERPTFLAAITGRLGTMLINMGLAAVIGSENNLVNKIGRKTNNKGLAEWPGIDPQADKFGIGVGAAIHSTAPQWADRRNEAFREKSMMSWSSQQKAAWAKGKSEFDVTTPYNQGINNLSRYIVQDVMYTVSTAALIHPIMNFLRKYVPGMTYTPKVEPRDELPQVNVPPHTLAQRAPVPRLPLPSSAPLPNAHVSAIHNESTLTQRPEQAVLHNG